MMRVVLLTSADCGFCPKAKEKMKKWIDRGEIEVSVDMERIMSSGHIGYGAPLVTLEPSHESSIVHG